MNPSLIIALSFHEADKAQAAKLVRLMADIEPAYREDVVLLLVRRFDTIQPLEMLECAAKKFPIATHRTATEWTGWPAGPNAMALNTFIHVNSRVKSGEWASAEALLMIEPDCVPCARDWIDALRDEWRVVNAMGERLQMGAWRDSGTAHGHINGNAMFPPDFAAKVPMALIGPDLAWDCSIVDYVKDKWAITHTIRNEFQSLGATDAAFDTREPLSGIAPRLVHGFKDDSALDLARRRMWV